MKFLVKDFCETVQARVVILGIQVNDDVLYRGIANQPSHAYSSLYLFNFLSFHVLNIVPCICPIFCLSILRILKFFVKDCCKTMQARVVIFGKQVDNNVLYRGIGNQHSHALICSSVHPSGISICSSVYLYY